MSAPRETLFPDAGTYLRSCLRNKKAMVSFGLAILQFAVHGSWLLTIGLMQSDDKTKAAEPSSTVMWAVSLLMITGTVLTMVALFLNLNAAIRTEPKLPAVVGLCLSFFAGATVFMVLLISLMGGG